MKRIIIKTISIFLSFALIFGGIAYAETSQTNENIFTKSMISEYSNAFTTEDYINNPFLDEYMREYKEFTNGKEYVTENELIAFYNRDSFKNMVAEQKRINDQKEMEHAKLYTKQNIDQLERVDRLAKEYYDYFQQYGKFPFENKEKGSI